MLKNFLKKVLKIVDIYGQELTLTVENQTKVKTIFGGVLSFLTIGMIIAAAWTTGNDLFYKNEPTTDLEDQLYKERPFFHLDKNAFPISFCFQDYNQATYNIPKYFRFEVTNYKTYNSNSSTETSTYEYENCTFDHFPKLDKEYLRTAGIDKYLCLKNQNITLGGYWDNTFIQYTVFRIRLCNNETDNGECAPKEEINAWINSRPIAFSVYFQNSIINTKDYLNPIQNFIFLIYKNVRINSSKVSNIFIKKSEIHTDSGIIFEEKKSESSISYDTSDYDDSDSLEDTLMDFNFFVANHSPILHRKYLKVQTVLANLGGLFKALFMGMYAICYSISKTKLNQILLNKIFHFTDEVRQSVTTNIHPTPSDTKLTQNNFVKQTESVQRVIKPNTSEIIESFKLKAKVKKLRISLLDNINMLFCKKCTNRKRKRKFLIYDQGCEVLNSHLDFSNIIHRFEQFEKMKFVIFDKYQLAMFQFISNEVINLNDNRRVRSEINDFKELLRDKEKMIDMLLQYRRNEHSSENEYVNELNRKLYSLLDDEIKTKLVI